MKFVAVLYGDAVEWDTCTVCERRDETGPDLILIARVVSVVTELTLRRKTQLLSGRQFSVSAFINVNYSTFVKCAVHS